MEDGTVVIDPEDNSKQIIQRMESLIEEASSDRNPESGDEMNPEAKNHRDLIRRQVKKADQSNK